MSFTVEVLVILAAIVFGVGVRMGWRAPHTLSMLVNATVAVGLFIVIFIGLVRPPDVPLTIIFSVAYALGGILGRATHNFWTSRPKKEKKADDKGKGKKDEKKKA
jgi:hypothetical protein